MQNKNLTPDEIKQIIKRTQEIVEIVEINDIQHDADVLDKLKVEIDTLTKIVENALKENE